MNLIGRNISNSLKKMFRKLTHFWAFFHTVRRTNCVELKKWNRVLPASRLLTGEKFEFTSSGVRFKKCWQRYFNENLAGLVWYGTFEILYRIRPKINYHKYRRVPQKDKNRKKVVPDAIFSWTMVSYKKVRFRSNKVQKQAQSRSGLKYTPNSSGWRWIGCKGGRCVHLGGGVLKGGKKNKNWSILPYLLKMWLIFERSRPKNIQFGL